MEFLLKLKDISCAPFTRFDTSPNSYILVSMGFVKSKDCEWQLFHFFVILNEKPVSFRVISLEIAKITGIERKWDLTI